MNVHAAVALAGIGFDRTRSKITADPTVDTNTHVIHLVGDGIDFEIRVSSFSEGGVRKIRTAFCMRQFGSGSWAAVLFCMICPAGEGNRI